MASLDKLRRARTVYRASGSAGVLSRLGQHGIDVAGARFPAVDRFCFTRSVSALRRLQETERSVPDVVRTPYLYSGYGHYRTLHSNQVQEEILTLAERVDEHDPDIAIEIGTASGGTLYIWSRLVAESGRLLSIDHSISDRKTSFFGSMGRPETDVIVGDSHATSTRDEVEEWLDGSSIDFLFIDGHGAYDSVRQDFELYEPLLSDGALVAFHDIQQPSTDGHGVRRFWNELGEKYESEELAVEPELERAGIGVLYL
jgi:predicted O-methyltransferase YrrM